MVSTLPTVNKMDLCFLTLVFTRPSAAGDFVLCAGPYNPPQSASCGRPTLSMIAKQRPHSHWHQQIAPCLGRCFDGVISSFHLRVSSSQFAPGGGTTWEPQTTDMSKFRQISLSLNDCDGFASNDSLFVDRIAGSIKGWSSGGRVGS